MGKAFDCYNRCTFFHTSHVVTMKSCHEKNGREQDVTEVIYNSHSYRLHARKGDK